MIATTWAAITARVPMALAHPAMMTMLSYLWLQDPAACGGWPSRRVARIALVPNKLEEHDCSGWPTGRAESLASGCPPGWVCESPSEEDGRDVGAHETSMAWI